MPRRNRNTRPLKSPRSYENQIEALKDQLAKAEKRLNQLEGKSGVQHVLDDGFVRLDRYSGDDLVIVNHARISLSIQKDVLDDSDEKLIYYLMRNRHGTPFESIFFSFHIRAPIFVARQWMRHRIAGYNEISGRYTQLDPKFYVPIGDLLRTQEGKQGNYEYVPITKQRTIDLIDYKMKRSYDEGVKTYNELLELGLAKELARVVLPTALYTEFYFDVNARSLMNFVSQRNHPHAQMEIQEYAREIEKFFAQVAPICYNSFVEYGRNAP